MFRRIFTKKILTNRLNFIKKNIFTTEVRKTPANPGTNLVFGKYLLVTNVISSGVLMFLGDLVQQEIEYQSQKLPKRYDLGRLTRMFIVGLAVGPLHHYYYVWLANRWPARTAKIITQKILMDQFLASPVFIACFFYGMGSLERKSIADMNNEVKHKFKEVYLVDWLVWPPTQFVNFYYVPAQYQVIYINAITTLYNVFLSYIKHKKMEADIPQANVSQVIPLENRSKKTTSHT